MIRIRRIAIATALFLPSLAIAQPSVPAAISFIRQQDLQRDMFALAGDNFRGREAGTLDEMRASMWVADAMRKIGVAPMGEDSTYFQWWDMRRTRISTPNSSVMIAGQPLALWTDITPTSNTPTDLTGTTVFVSDVRDTTVNIAGRIAVAVLLPPQASAIRSTTNTYDYNYTRSAITATSGPLLRRGVAGVILVADSIGDLVFDAIGKLQSRGTYDVVGGVPRFSRNSAQLAAAGSAPNPVTPVRPLAAPITAPPVLLVRRGALPRVRADGQQVDVHIRRETFDYPSVNIIGVVRGTDPALRDEYVVFSSHQDHDGVRYTVAGDSIWNGADDNATTSVALLAIARAWVKQPARRSALFIFHGAEERGLLGSRYHVAHPVVPLATMAAVLNGDMIGRNHPDTAALMGSQPPHRNSAALVDMAITANRMTSKFAIDSTWDRPNHPEGWYFRSDHVPYAERGVPALFFSSNLHSDYHTPRDEPKTIDYTKLHRITQWMYMTGWIAANGPRPTTDPGFILR